MSKLTNDERASRWVGVGVMLVNALARELGHVWDVMKSRLHVAHHTVR